MNKTKPMEGKADLYNIFKIIRLFFAIEFITFVRSSYIIKFSLKQIQKIALKNVLKFNDTFSNKGKMFLLFQRVGKVKYKQR